MAPRRKATTTAPPPPSDVFLPPTSLELGNLPPPPASDDDGNIQEDMATLTSLLERGGSQPLAGPSSAPAGEIEPTLQDVATLASTLDKGKGPAVDSNSPPLSNLAVSPTLSDLNLVEGPEEGTRLTAFRPRPLRALSPTSPGPRQPPSVQSGQPLPSTSVERGAPVLGKRPTRIQEDPSLSERIVLTPAELEDILRAHTARFLASSAVGSVQGEFRVPGFVYSHISPYTGSGVSVSQRICRA
ncbi:hypothetical protein M378DRAFT_466572 [Amanita muscaria Koide BX008]|uniref:Uncharacterized protein n=1 Tax=Amanita muscaria (strain Koide BX008) TaxID=946122 RepID=A0A0C2SRC5_AMAMK|nr:hypothetical protein M378DRAFT_466572 [Amanita muscaria Koide BX008]